MTEKRMMASDPEYSLYNDLWNKYAVLKNPQVWFNEYDLEIYEQSDIQEVLENYMQDLLDGLPAIYLQKLIDINSGLTLDKNE